MLSIHNMEKKTKLFLKALWLLIGTLLALATIVTITVASTVWGNKQVPWILGSQGPTNVSAILNLLLIPTTVMITVAASNLSNIAKMWYTTDDKGLPLECWNLLSGLPGPYSAYKLIKHRRINVLSIGLPLFAVWVILQGTNALQNAGLESTTTLKKISSENIVTTGNVSVQQYLDFPQIVSSQIQSNLFEAYTIVSQLNSYQVPTFVDGISRAQLTGANIENIGKFEIKTLYIPAYGAIVNITHLTDWDISNTIIETYGPVVSIEMTCGPVHNNANIATDPAFEMVVPLLSESNVQSNNGLGVSLVGIFVNINSLLVTNSLPIQLITTLCTLLLLNPSCTAIYTCFANATYDSSCLLKINATTNAIINKDNCKQPNVIAGKQLLAYQLQMLILAGESINNQTLLRSTSTLLYQQLLFGGQTAVNAGVRPEGYANLLSTGIGTAGLFGDNTASYQATIYLKVQQLRLILWANIALYTLLTVTAILITICSLNFISTARVNIDVEPTYFLLTKAHEIIGHNMQNNQNNEDDNMTHMHNTLPLVVRNVNGRLVAVLDDCNLNGAIPDPYTFYKGV